MTLWRARKRTNLYTKRAYSLAFLARSHTMSKTGLSRFVRFPRRWGLLSLAGGLLAACGGGGGGNSETPPGSDVVAVQFTAPAAEEVYTASSPLALAARVTVNGADAADGTAVSFAAGATAAAAGSTKGGIATATLSGAAVGRQQLQASATVLGRSATAVRTVYLRPAASPLEVLVPAYFYPSGAGAAAWTALTAGTAANPAVKVTAILNPSDGVFTQVEAPILAAATQFSAAGGRLLGYVYTSYGDRSVAAIKANIDAYFSLYGRGLIGGIFLDEMAATPNKLSVYQELYQYIKAKDPNLRVVGNPGMVPAAGYGAVADVLTVFEGKGSTFQTYDPRTVETDWVYTRGSGTQAALVHNVANCAAMQAAVQSAASARYNTGVLFATSLEYEPATGVGNPWNGMPAYWNTLLQTVRSVNAGQPLPAC